ncbi:MAG TPA: hypothetical protein DCZ94_13080 [Lentisphaeria bacterium]|nr:MAG: hypothetical protein A2X48_06210 [Lentisphaerae bacterium GWF2_49_21]HBC87882.1 hypothetical protein [Lentisphaeria bacterium]
MNGSKTYFERNGIKLTDEALVIKDKNIPVGDITSFELSDCGINKTNLAVVILIGISGYFVLWFCSGNNSFIAMDSLTGVFFLGIVVFSAIVVLRSLGGDKDAVKITVRTRDGRSSSLKINEVKTAVELEDALRRVLEKKPPAN